MKITSREVMSTFGALGDTLNSADAALINARQDMYNAEQADDFLELANALLAIRQVLYKASKAVRNVGHV